MWNIPKCQDRSPTRQGSEPSCCFTEPKGSLHHLKYFQMNPERQVEGKRTQICACKNSPVFTAAYELGGSSNRWLLSNFPIPQVVSLSFPSISFPGTWFWQAVDPLESTVSFKVIPTWYSNQGQPTHMLQSQKHKIINTSHAQNTPVTLLGCSCILTSHFS